MSEVVSPLFFQLCVGGVGGFTVGFALKKLRKLILFLIGIFIVVLIYLSTQGAGASGLECAEQLARMGRLSIFLAYWRDIPSAPRSKLRGRFSAWT